MPQPIIPVPTFPNVPALPGVPPLVRSGLGAITSLFGPITGQANASGQFTGSVEGFLQLPSGQTLPVLAGLSGALDDTFNFSALLNVATGGLSGQVVGTIQGAVTLAGVVQGQVSAFVNQLTGNTEDLATDNPEVVAQAEPFVWGIYKDGEAILTGDAVATLDDSREFRIANYPMEQGAFQSYNKVEQPFMVELDLVKSGTVSERQTFLAKVDELLKSLDLVDVRTPEKTYLSVNVTRSTQRRQASRGANQLTVGVRLEQVRETAQTTYTNTKDPTGAATTNTGPVQAGPPGPTVPPDPGAA